MDGTIPADGAVTVDVGRVPGAVVRLLRVGQRHDRIVLIVDEHVVAVTLQTEGALISDVRTNVGTVPLPPWEQTK